MFRRKSYKWITAYYLEHIPGDDLGLSLRARACQRLEAWKMEREAVQGEEGCKIFNSCGFARVCLVSKRGRDPETSLPVSHGFP